MEQEVGGEQEQVVAEGQGLEMQEGTGVESGSAGDFQSVGDSMEVDAGQEEGELRDRVMQAKEVQAGLLTRFRRR